MQGNALSSPKLGSNVVKSSALRFWKAKHRVRKCYQGHRHEEEVDISSTQDLEWNKEHK